MWHCIWLTVSSRSQQTCPAPLDFDTKQDPVCSSKHHQCSLAFFNFSIYKETVKRCCIQAEASFYKRPNFLVLFSIITHIIQKTVVSALHILFGIFYFTYVYMETSDTVSLVSQVRYQHFIEK